MASAEAARILIRNRKIDHARFGRETLRHVCEVPGNPDECRLYIGAGRHRYWRDGAWQSVNEMFARVPEAYR